MMDETTAGADAEILFRVDDEVGTLTLNRPQARNALTYTMYDGLRAICEAQTREPTLRGLVITGAGDKAFAAGTDINQFRELHSADDALAYETRIEGVLDALERVPMPTVAAIRGACTGGGAAIAAACDLRVASRDARFGFPIARTLGNCLSAANLRRLAALIGAGRVREMIFTSALLSAEQALQAGLVTTVVDDSAALDAHLEDLFDTLREQAPLTLRATKEALRRLQHAERVDDADLVELCYTSADFREGLEAFLAKRKPTWQGR
ncbi:MAG: enoyl-CoA hydratase [Gammaproteobacteria bacterium]|jgi:enoyl-CoA hydratase/carnithine racemase|nr:enoyl-CoA hydratase [Gammaproteobacteria bacterium]